MKSRFFPKTILVVALALLVGACVLCGCQKNDGFLSDNLRKTAASTPGLTLESVGEWSDDRATVVFFHGKTEETEVFTPNIPVSVYDENVTYANASVNAETIGFKQRGLAKTADGSAYDLLSYWTDVARYNVLVVHAEKYFAFEESECAAKIYSAYRSGYSENGAYVAVDAGYPLSELIAALLADKVRKRRELRFVGYGVGGNLAMATARYLYAARRAGAGEIAPSRVTLCDPYLSDEPVTYGPRWDEGVADAATYAARDAAYLDERAVALEVVETEEVGESAKYYAWDESVREGEAYASIKRVSAFLTFSERYSFLPPVKEYRLKKRLAFDWYVYSVVGSDDAQDYAVGSQKYAIGYPHSYYAMTSETAYSTVNWAYDGTPTDGRRPILNDRARTNDEQETAGARYGRNFAVGAWTPTNYVRGLRGVAFSQKEGTKKAGEADVFGNNVYAYAPYVLSSFRSENYQVADLDRTIVAIRAYYDEDGDGLLDDGADNGVGTRGHVTITRNDGKPLLERTSIPTDDNGYVYVVLKDAADDDEPFTCRIEGNVVYCDGYSTASTDDGFLSVTFETYVPRGYTARGNAASGYWYRTSQQNNAVNGVATVEVNPFVVHSVLPGNVFFHAEGSV